MSAWEKHYGRYKIKPDFSRCCVSVWDGDGWYSHQCRRKARYDRDDEGRPTHCKQHSDEATAQRRAAQKAKFDADMAKIRERGRAAKYKAALEKIANGANDARQVARSALGWEND